MKKLILIALAISFTGILANAKNKIPRDSLIVYYPFNGDFNDHSGNNYNGKANNGAVPWKIDTSLEAGLSNGRLNPDELAGQKITILDTRPYGYGVEYFDLTKHQPEINLMLAFKPDTKSTDNTYLPSYTLAVPHEHFSIDGIKIHPIPSLNRGMGYLVEVDGIKVFHSGFHASGNDSSQIEKYRKEIDFLKTYGPIDIAILPINGHYRVTYENYLYLLDQLTPKTVYLMGDPGVPEEEAKCVEALKARNVPVNYPDGGLAIGQRFHFIRE